MTNNGQYTIDPTGNKRVILSVDGGGMRGAISIAMLAELENQTGKTCCEMFDMVAGTSTGAIIAAALAVGMSANEILDKVYCNALPTAFRKAGDVGVIGDVLAGVLKFFGREDNEFLARLASHELQYAYPLNHFVDELNDLVECQTIGELQYKRGKNPILFVTTKDMLTRDTQFIVTAGAGKNKFKDWTLPAVVACSGAAPIFFPPVEHRYVDGGVGVYANPCLAASIEAIEYIGSTEGFDKGNVIHVSLGTGYVDSRPTADEVKGFNVIDWLRYLVLEGINDGALQQVFATRAIYGDRSSQNPQPMDFRRYNPMLSTQSVTQLLGRQLADNQKPAALGLDSYGEDDVELMIQIGRTYARHLDWSKSNVMPWDTFGGHLDPGKTMDYEAVDWSKTMYACES